MIIASRPLAGVLVLLGLMLALEITSLRGMSATPDEFEHLKYGTTVLTEPFVRPLMQRMPITALNAAPVLALEKFGVEMTAARQLKIGRSVTIAFSVLLALLVFVWSKRLYGLRGALLSLTLCVFCPNLLAHGRLITNDVYCTFFMTLSLFLFIRYLEAPSLRRLLLAAGATGIAQISKQTALLLFPCFALLALMSLVRAPRHIGRSAAHAFLFVLVVLLTMNAAYLFKAAPPPDYVSEIAGRPDGPVLQKAFDVTTRLHVAMIPVPFPYIASYELGVAYNTLCVGHLPNYLCGQTSACGWWYYFPVAMLLKFPLAVFALFAGALVITPAFFRRQPVDEAGLLLLILAVVLFFTLKCTAQIGVRYLLPILPLLYVFLGKLAALTPSRRTGPYMVLIGGLLVWFCVSSLSFFPHYIAYFNETIGDRKNMYKYLADSNVDWGQADGYLRAYLARLPAEARVAVNPREPTAGIVVVNINALLGLDPYQPDFSWLRDQYEPVGHIGYAWLIFNVPAEL